MAVQKYHYWFFELQNNNILIGNEFLEYDFNIFFNAENTPVEGLQLHQD